MSYLKELMNKSDEEKSNHEKALTVVAGGLLFVGTVAGVIALIGVIFLVGAYSMFAIGSFGNYLTESLNSIYGFNIPAGTALLAFISTFILWSVFGKDAKPTPEEKLKSERFAVLCKLREYEKGAIKYAEMTGQPVPEVLTYEQIVELGGLDDTLGNPEEYEEFKESK